MDENFIRERITQLRLKKGISEYQMISATVLVSGRARLMTNSIS